MLVLRRITHLERSIVVKNTIVSIKNYLWPSILIFNASVRLAGLVRQSAVTIFRTASIIVDRIADSTTLRDQGIATLGHLILCR